MTVPPCSPGCQLVGVGLWAPGHQLCLVLLCCCVGPVVKCDQSSPFGAQNVCRRSPSSPDPGLYCTTQELISRDWSEGGASDSPLYDSCHQCGPVVVVSHSKSHILFISQLRCSLDSLLRLYFQTKMDTMFHFV